MEEPQKSINVKDDKNFLEYPLWILDKRKAVRQFSIAKDNGTYEISTASDRLPDRVDKLILYYLITQLFDSDPSIRHVEMTRYQIIKNVFDVQDGSYYYTRVLTAIKRWHDIAVKFEGVFYDGENYTTRGFHIIDNYKLDHETGIITIDFNKDYLTQIRQSNYYKMVDFNKIKKLKRDVSVRLYELLVKQVLPWNINVKKLAQKLTLNEKYPSDILAKVRPAVNEINSNTDLKVELSCKESKSGERICTFDELPGRQLLLNAIPISENPFAIPAEVLSAIPEEFRIDSVFSVVESYCENPEYAISNVLYTNKNCDKNYALYLKKALEEDYAKAAREIAQKKKEIQEKVGSHKKAELERDLVEQQKREQNKKLLEALSQTEYETLKTRAQKNLEAAGFQTEFIRKPMLETEMYNLLNGENPA